MKLIPSDIGLRYERPPNFQLAPQLLVDVEPPEGYTLSRRWVIVGRVDVIEKIITQGGKTTVTIHQDYRGSGTRGGTDVEVEIGEIIAERYVHHAAHGRTRYVAATVLNPLMPTRPWRINGNGRNSITRGRRDAR